jgi:KUP system potassium uptake protein
MAQTAAASHGVEAEHSDKHFWALAVGSIGVVYGDIGTSPLYALREAVTAAKQHGTAMPEAVLGILSLIVWTLMLIVSNTCSSAQRRQRGRAAVRLMALGHRGQRSAPDLVLGVAVTFFYSDAVTPAFRCYPPSKPEALYAGPGSSRAAHQSSSW